MSGDIRRNLLGEPLYAADRPWRHTEAALAQSDGAPRCGRCGRVVSGEGADCESCTAVAFEQALFRDMKAQRQRVVAEGHSLDCGCDECRKAFAPALSDEHRLAFVKEFWAHHSSSGRHNMIDSLYEYERQVKERSGL